MDKPLVGLLKQLRLMVNDLAGEREYGIVLNIAQEYETAMRAQRDAWLDGAPDNSTLADCAADIDPDLETQQ